MRYKPVDAWLIVSKENSRSRLLRLFLPRDATRAVMSQYVVRLYVCL